MRKIIKLDSSLRFGSLIHFFFFFVAEKLCFFFFSVFDLIFSPFWEPFYCPCLTPRFRPSTFSDFLKKKQKHKKKKHTNTLTQSRSFFRSLSACFSAPSPLWRCHSRFPTNSWGTIADCRLYKTDSHLGSSRSLFFFFPHIYIPVCLSPFFFSPFCVLLKAHPCRRSNFLLFCLLGEKETLTPRHNLSRFFSLSRLYLDPGRWFSFTSLT